MFGTTLDFEQAFVDHRPMHRTYVRRRFGVLAAGLALVAALSGPVSGALGAGREQSLVSSRTYVVRPGDTLWDIAATVAPGRDPREVVHDLDLLNDAPVDRLTPGMVLAIPR